MKTFSVAVAVAVVLIFICFQESSAFPFAGVKELDEPMSNDEPAAENEEMPVSSRKMPFNIRQKRQGMNCGLCCHINSKGVRSCIRCCT
uniref:Hepcidin type II n=1 Tax=Sebastes schlegelii TaxID=214486 RepID=C1IDZ9_SEBSC|nr:hepcidin precursor type II [Sebastes schlegelii]ACD80123.1 hepcidin precursor type II [Sebastes schlegelii]